jgi:hypothetical protein
MVSKCPAGNDTNDHRLEIEEQSAGLCVIRFIEASDLRAFSADRRDASTDSNCVMLSGGNGVHRWYWPTCILLYRFGENTLRQPIQPIGL